MPPAPESFRRKLESKAIARADVTTRADLLEHACSLGRQLQALLAKPRPRDPVKPRLKHGHARNVAMWPSQSAY